MKKLGKKLYQDDIDKVVKKELEKQKKGEKKMKKEARNVKTMIRLTETEKADIGKISKDIMGDNSLSATIARLIREKIKAHRNELKGE